MIPRGASGSERKSNTGGVIDRIADRWGNGDDRRFACAGGWQVFAIEQDDFDRQAYREIAGLDNAKTARS